MGFSNRSIEELDVGVMKKAYYILGISTAGLFLLMLNWVGISSFMYYIMSMRKIMLGMTYYIIPMATAMVGFAITQIPSTMILNKAGNRVPIFLGLLMNGLSTIFATTNNYYTALFLRFLSGMGMGLYLLPTMLLLLGWWSIRGMTRWIQLVYLTLFSTAFIVSLPLAKLIGEATLYLGLASIALSLVMLFTAKDAVIIRRASIMAVMNNPDVLLMSVAFSAPWGLFLGLNSSINETTNTTLLLTVPLLLIPILYRFRKRFSINRLRMLKYATIALGIATTALGITEARGAMLMVVGVLFAFIALLILAVVNELVSPLLIVQTLSYLFTVSSILGSMVAITMGYAVDHLGQLGWVITGGLIVASSLIYRILKITL